MKIVTLFNNKGGVGKTTIAYHLAHMLAKLDYRTLAVDLDPQANLSAAFLDDLLLEMIWELGQIKKSVYNCISPIMEGIGDIAPPDPIKVEEDLLLVYGDLRLSLFEDKLSDSWPRCYEGDKSALRATTAFYRMIVQSAEKIKAEIVIVDIGPNLGAINRAALLASDYLVFPLGADMFSLQGLRNLGPTVVRWRDNWRTIIDKNRNLDFPIPQGRMEPLGYVVTQPSIRLDRPVKAYQQWLNKIPQEYRKSVLGKETDDKPAEPDPYCLATLRHYRSLIPLFQEHHKPVFDLKPADGAFGSHVAGVQASYKEFKSLAETIIKKINN